MWLRHIFESVMGSRFGLLAILENGKILISARKKTSHEILKYKSF